MVGNWLDGLRREAAEVCRPHLDMEAKATPGKRFVLVDIGDGWRYGAIDNEAPTRVDDALELFAIIRTMETHLDDQGSLTDDFDWVFFKAVKLGATIERFNSVRPIEGDAARGKKIIEHASAGGKLNAKLNESQKSEAVSMVTSLIRKGMGQTAACKQVCKDFGVSYKTIERAFKS